MKLLYDSKLLRTLLTASTLALLSNTVVSKTGENAHNQTEKHRPKQAHQFTQSANLIETLSPQLQLLLKQEMQAIQKGVQTIISAFAAGEFATIKQTAQQISDSFIFKKKLTASQIDELHNNLTPAFIQLDNNFHYYAGMLSHVAEKEKAELVNFYLGKLTESCFACHSQFATHQFPAFKNSQTDEKHHHQNNNQSHHSHE
ncbi:hypothetical protein [Aliikangiella maris]|uniref:Uncharacterized protein n=2 Tax=Aliikangiella maris TaxID=3162458 RepID=A0ABV3MS42_9GAMM